MSISVNVSVTYCHTPGSSNGIITFNAVSKPADGVLTGVGTSVNATRFVYVHPTCGAFNVSVTCTQTSAGAMRVDLHFTYVGSTPYCNSTYLTGPLSHTITNVSLSATNVC